MDTSIEHCKEGLKNYIVSKSITRLNVTWERAVMTRNRVMTTHWIAYTHFLGFSQGREQVSQVSSIFSRHVSITLGMPFSCSIFLRWVTTWHSAEVKRRNKYLCGPFLHSWTPQDRVFSQARPHEKRGGVEHTLSNIACSPKHPLLTTTGQGGHFTWYSFDLCTKLLPDPLEWLLVVVSLFSTFDVEVVFLSSHDVQLARDSLHVSKKLSVHYLVWSHGKLDYKHVHKDTSLHTWNYILDKLQNGKCV